jgi:integrase
MSWEPKTRRWRKLVDGKSYVVSVRQLKRAGYLPTDAAETKEASYRAANRWWLDHGKEPRNSPRPEPHSGEVAVIERKRDWCRRHGQDEEASRYDQQIKTVRALAPDVSVYPALGPEPRVQDFIRVAEALGAVFPPGFAEEYGWVVFDDPLWADRFHRDAATTVPVDRTVAAWVDRYLDMVMSRYKVEEISAAEYQATRLSLHAFRDWCGQATGIDSLDPETWERWWHHLLKSDYSVATKKKRILYVRSLIRWMASKGVIPMPPNLNERRYGFKEAHPAVAMPDLEEIRRVVDAATGQLRLHLLLMLNCAFTQIDVANLRQDEVDWEHGRIKRKRTKTKSKKAVPVVNYTLWSETWTLLKKFREPSGDLVLRTHSGKAWVRDEIDPAGKRHKTDQIRTNYGHLRRKLDAKLSLSKLRKVGASLLADNREYADFAQRFLGHAPTTMAEQRYIGNDAGQKYFDEAVEWIRNEIGLSPS